MVASPTAMETSQRRAAFHLQLSVKLDYSRRKVGRSVNPVRGKRLLAPVCGERRFLVEVCAAPATAAVRTQSKHVLHRHGSWLHSIGAQTCAACSQTKPNHSFNASTHPELCQNYYSK